MDRQPQQQPSPAQSRAARHPDPRGGARHAHALVHGESPAQARGPPAHRARLPHGVGAREGRAARSTSSSAIRPEEVEEAVRAELGEGGAVFVTQTEQRGTGDAVFAAREALGDADSTLLVLSGDVPLVRAETLGSLVHQHRTHRGRGAACTLMAVRLEDPTGYGRVVRDEEGRFQKIVEQKDATPEERQIGEINAGIYCFETRAALPRAGARPARERAGRVLPDGRARPSCAPTART